MSFGFNAGGHDRVIGKLPTDITAKERAAISHDQLAAYYKNVLPGSATNVVNAILLAIAFTPNVSPLILMGWVGCVTITALLHVWMRHTGLRQGDDMDADRELARNMHGALLIGALWGIATAYLATQATPTQSVVLGVVAAGMLNGGIHSLRSVPTIAISFLVPFAIGILLFFVSFGLRNNMVDGTILIIMNIIYSVMLIHALKTSFEAFADQSLGRIRARDSAETVSLLLKDYEDQGADWLWEVDTNGKLGMVGRTFANAAERPLELLSNSNFIDLFEDSPERDTLIYHFEHCAGFRDFTVPLLVHDEQRWWTLSARPRTDGHKVVGLRGVATDVTHSRQAEAKIAYMAHYDSLTDLPNRFLFNETFSRMLKTQGPAESLAVFYIDLDNFKNINDTLGHPVGDGLLRKIGKLLEDCVSEGDVVARLGGDEFAILSSSLSSEDDIEFFAEKVLQVIATPIGIDGNHLLPTASIGTAISPRDGQSVTDLLRHADLALYNSKENGRNRFSFFDPSMDEAARKRRDIEMNLREALQNNELSLAYQPLVNISTGETIGYEALMRWMHPERGAVSPEEFIPIAEDTGLIIQLGEWVIREAIRKAAQWPDNLTVSINLSPAQMRSAGLITTVINALAATQIAPQRIEFEITESVLMHDSEANFSILHKLREIGVSIALDDFGTGYCSLNYLRSFPFDKIKIDRSFVNEVETSAESRAIVQSVVQLASSLGMMTTAEGVERQEQLIWLRSEGCMIGQGFLFSPAIPAGELTDLRRPHQDIVSINDRKPQADGDQKMCGKLRANSPRR